MNNLYNELYMDCCEDEMFHTSAHFVGMRGKKYNDKSNNSKINFLIVRRAPNGWESLPTGTADSFAYEANQQFESIQRFEWISSKNGVLYSQHCNDYCIDSKPFWSYSKAVLGRLWKNMPTDDKWVEYIAWTNLYKISPSIKGNPSDELMKKQLSTCRKIFEKELSVFEPTHILFLTGYEWFCDFADVFEKVSDSGLRNVMRGKNKNSVFVEGTASIGETKAVIACRPEFRNKEKYISAVTKAFDTE